MRSTLPRSTNIGVPWCLLGQTTSARLLTIVVIGAAMQDLNIVFSLITSLKFKTEVRYWI